MEKINFIALHGFLGRPSDWGPLQEDLYRTVLKGDFEWWSVDYMQNPVLNPEQNYAKWSRNFCEKVRLKFDKGPRILLGYSLGGRLALQALKQEPGLFDAVILVSANPGLQKEKERQDRWQNDVHWARKFAKENWSPLLQEWNNQSVFKGGIAEPERSEKDYNREHLALALKEWSLSKQEDFRPLICQQSKKILWMVGERDLKFASLAQELQKAAPGLTVEFVKNSSHRVLFDNHLAIAISMLSFLERR